MKTTRTALGLGLLVLGLYLVTSARTQPYGDGEHQTMLARRVLFEGRVDVPGEPGRFLFEGKDGRTFVPFSLGAALSHTPGVLLTEWLVEEHDRELLVPVLHRVSTSLFGALTAVVFFLLLVELAVPRRTAALTALVLAFATQTWVYAHSHFSENYQAFSLCLAVYATVLAARRPSTGRALFLGAAWGGLLVAKLVYLALGPLVLAWLVHRFRARPRRLLTTLALALLAFLPFAAVELGYNYVRTGSPFETGRRFDHFDSALGGSFLVGFHGLVLSPGKGIFWFNPILLVALAGIGGFWRRCRAEALLVGGVVATLVGVHALYNFWHGAWSWGPRFLTAAVPLMLVPLAFIPWAEVRRGWKVAAAGVLAVSLWVQVLGNAYYHAHNVHLNNRARKALLGASPREGCGWCHENHYPVHFIPEFSPILVHQWLLESRIAGHSLEEARQTAPWAPYFPPEMNARVPIYFPPIDSWFVVWLSHYDRMALTGWGYLLVSVLILLSGLVVWRWRADPAHSPDTGTANPPAPSGA